MPPLTRLCHVCGRQYGLSSFDIHLKQCKKLWIAHEEKKPPHERREMPKTPPGLEEAVQKGGKAAKNAVDALNRAAAEQFNQTMEKCPNCSRTFAEGRLEIHSRSCRPDSVAKRVEDGAVPRNKKVLPRDYGRVTKPHDSDDTAPPSTASASSPHRQPNIRSVSAKENYDTSEYSVRPATSASRLEQTGGRSLAGSLASNRKKVELQQNDNRQNLVSPLAPSGAEISTSDLAKAVQGHEDVLTIIEAKLDRWEAVTLTTLQEIRDLKQVFSMIKRKK